MKKWFKAKRFGWGWRPASKEGWIVTLIWVVYTLASSFGLGYILEHLESYDRFLYKIAFGIFWLNFVFGITMLLIIAYITGEKPSWRWGDDERR